MTKSRLVLGNCGRFEKPWLANINYSSEIIIVQTKNSSFGQDLVKILEGSGLLDSTLQTGLGAKVSAWALPNCMLILILSLAAFVSTRERRFGRLLGACQKGSLLIPQVAQPTRCHVSGPLHPSIQSRTAVFDHGSCGRIFWSR